MFSNAATDLTFPALPAIPGLTEDERAAVSGLGNLLLDQRRHLLCSDRYYDGVERVKDLGISVPPQLNGLHTVIGWPRQTVESLDERLDVDGFRFADSDDADDDLLGYWTANDMESEHQLANLDALIFGRSYVLLGSSEPDIFNPDVPRITVESPLNVIADYDLRTRRYRTVLQSYVLEMQAAFALYTPGSTVHIVYRQGTWEVVSRDNHGFPFAPVVQVTNRPRTRNRMGASEITPEVRSTTDAAARRLLGLEVASEFYQAPQRYALGVRADAFTDKDGNPIPGWEAILGRMMAFERDGDGEVPEVGQFAAMDPSVYTEIIDMHARIMAGLTGMPASFLGLTTENPPSADAIRMSTERLVRRAQRKQRTFSPAWRDVMRMALLLDKKPLPEDSHRMEVLWHSADVPTPGATADAIVKQVQVGAIPPTSDVTLEALGWGPVQRRRLEADRQKAEGDAILNGLAQPGPQNVPPGGIGGGVRTSQPANLE